VLRRSLGQQCNFFVCVHVGIDEHDLASEIDDRFHQVAESGLGERPQLVDRNRLVRCNSAHGSGAGILSASAPR